MSRWIAAITVGLGLLTARAQAQGAAEAPDLRHWTFTLENIRYRILLPKSATAVSRVDGFIASLSPRLMRQLHLGPAPRVGGRTYAHVKQLSGGAVLRYQVEYDIGGGSGGTEAALEGVLEIGTAAIAITCLDQDDLYTPRPDWCLPFLGQIRTDPDAK